MALGPLVMLALAMLVKAAGEPTCADGASISAPALCPAWAARFPLSMFPFAPAVSTSVAPRPWQGPGCRGAHAARTRMAARDEGELAQRKRRVMLRVRIRIMEDVVRRVNDPTLSYPRKRETVSELEGYLRRMRALTVDHEPSVPDSIVRWPEVQRRKADDERRRRAQAQIEQTMSRMRDAKAVAVLRGKSPQRLVARGLELAHCGCKCMEVTLDSPGAMAVVRTLAEQLPNAVLLGAATAMGAEDAAAAISAGAKFVTSPIAASEIISVCEEAGVLALPAGLTPTEIYSNIAAGARAVKVFPASVVSPEGLKAILSLGPFHDTLVMAAGGVRPRDVTEWLAAGAGAVALGTHLVGADIQLATSPGPPGGGVRDDSEVEWEARGRQEAAALFAALCVL